MFDRNRHVELVDGRDLVVTYEGEDFGWSAYIPGDTKRPTLAAAPAAAIVAHLDFAAGEVPGWVYAFSERFVQDLRDTPRHVCDCCGYRTLLNAGFYEICPVCGWEDDRDDTGRIRGGPDAPSGPNRISLTQARANYAALGAAKERSRPHVRRPTAEESV